MKNSVTTPFVKMVEHVMRLMALILTVPVFMDSWERIAQKMIQVKYFARKTIPVKMEELAEKNLVLKQVVPVSEDSEEMYVVKMTQINTFVQKTRVKMVVPTVKHLAH